MAEMDETDREQTFDAEESGDAVNSLDADLAKLQGERDILFQQLARVQADFANAKKRLEAERDQHVQFANSTLLKGLLPVIDNFERALEVDSAKTDTGSLVKGMQIVHDQLLAALKSQKLEPIAPAVGTPFDPNEHEALMQQPSDQYAEPAVLQLYQKGYKLHGRIIRPAQVVVSRPADA